MEKSVRNRIRFGFLTWKKFFSLNSVSNVMDVRTRGGRFSASSKRFLQNAFLAGFELYDESFCYQDVYNLIEYFHFNNQMYWITMKCCLLPTVKATPMKLHIDRHNDHLKDTNKNSLAILLHLSQIQPIFIFLNIPKLSCTSLSLFFLFKCTSIMFGAWIRRFIKAKLHQHYFGFKRELNMSLFLSFFLNKWRQTYSLA